MNRTENHARAWISDPVSRVTFHRSLRKLKASYGIPRGVQVCDTIGYERCAVPTDLGDVKVNILALAAISLLIDPIQDPAYAITLKSPLAAKQVKISQEDIRTIDVAVFVNGARTNRKSTDARRIRFTDEVLARDRDGSATKIRRIYADTANYTNGFRRPSFELDKPIVASKKGSQFAYSFEEDKPIHPGMVALLESEFNPSAMNSNHELLLPNKPIKVNENWTIDSEKLAIAMGVTDMTIDLAKSSAKGKLSKYYRKNDQSWGTLEFQIELRVTKLTSGFTTVTLRPVSQLSASLTLDACIDGSDMSYEATRITRGSIEGEASGLQMMMSLEGKSSSRGEELKK